VRRPCLKDGMSVREALQYFNTGRETMAKMRCHGLLFRNCAIPENAARISPDPAHTVGHGCVPVAVAIKPVVPD
jgi:hypothetical protein